MLPRSLLMQIIERKSETNHLPHATLCCNDATPTQQAAEPQQNNGFPGTGRMLSPTASEQGEQLPLHSSALQCGTPQSACPACFMEPTWAFNQLSVEREERREREGGGRGMSFPLHIGEPARRALAGLSALPLPSATPLCLPPLLCIVNASRRASFHDVHSHALLLISIHHQSRHTHTHTRTPAPTLGSSRLGFS